MFSVLLFAADTQRLRSILRDDAQLASEVLRRAQSRGVYSAEELEELRLRAMEGRIGKWRCPGDRLSVDAFLWMLDYAAEPVTLGRLRDIRDDRLIGKLPFVEDMLAATGPIPLPEVARTECRIGFLSPAELACLATRDRQPYDDRFVEGIATELEEVFESLAEDNLGLYTVVT
jgi:hypothetical protein